MKDFDEFISILSDLVKNCQSDKEFFERGTTKIKGDERVLSLVKTMYVSNANKSDQLQLAFRLIRLLAEDVKTLTTAMEKLVDKEESTEIKRELASIRTVVDDVVIPIKQEMEEKRKRDVRGGEVYE